ncbi:MAG: tyrosine-type recombinase/integrase [Bacteroidota bacterium]
MDNESPLYSVPQLYDGGLDISKKWRVDYYFTHPITGERERFFAPRENANRIKDVDKRLAEFEKIRLKMLAQLQSGFCPYPGIDLKHLPEKKVNYTTIIDALEAVLKHKQTYVDEETTLPVYKSHVNLFKNWLISKRMGTLKPNEVTSEHIFAYLDYLMIERKNAARSRNNHLVDLTSMFTSMKKINRTWVTENPCEDIEKLPTKSHTNKPYSAAEFKRIADWVREYDIYFYYFLRCEIYFSIRPVEIVKMQVKDIDLQLDKLTLEAVKAKQRVRKIKRIFAVHKADFEALDIANLPGHYYIFTSKGEPGPVRTNRDYFTRRFGKIKKLLGIEPEQTMYALRHTFIIDLVKNANKYNLNTKEIMAISGHTSLQSFQNYIQKYLDEPAEDVSARFSLSF